MAGCGYASRYEKARTDSSHNHISASLKPSPHEAQALEMASLPGRSRGNAVRAGFKFMKIIENPLFQANLKFMKIHGNVFFVQDPNS